MHPDPELVWKKFILLVSLDNNDGNVIEAVKHPAQNFWGSIPSHKKIFDRAVKEAIEEMKPAPPPEPDWPYKANFEGFCRACGEPIKPGDEVTVWGAPDDEGRWIHRKHPRKQPHTCSLPYPDCVAHDEEHHHDVGGEG